MYDNILFYVVFLSQLLLVSHFYPQKVLSQMRQMLSRYPATEYPKFYTKPVEFYANGMRIYEITNKAILTLGIILLVSIGVWDGKSEGYVPEMLPFAFWGLQIIPFLLIELFGYTNSKMMREADKRTTRNADLNPRRLFDFVSPVMVGLSVFMYVGTILFFYMIHGFEFHPRNDTLVIFVSLSLMNLLFVAIITWNLRGKKKDPHQAHSDRIRQMGVSLRSLFVMSIVASVFIVTVEGLQTFELKYLASSLMSLYLQLTVAIGIGSILRSLRLEDMNFDVYREDVSLKEAAKEGAR